MANCTICGKYVSCGCKLNKGKCSDCIRKETEKLKLEEKLKKQNEPNQ